MALGNLRENRILYIAVDRGLSGVETHALAQPTC
jgi:hypothetical protein